MVFDLGEFDLDITLTDLSLDARLSPEQRMIANASIGIEPQDAYYSVAELRQAVDWTRKGETRGQHKLTTILAAKCDDFQRCVYFCLAGRGADDMHDALFWLEGVLATRAALSAKLLIDSEAIACRRKPYIAYEPDGPLPGSSELKLGASWHAAS